MAKNACSYFLVYVVNGMAMEIPFYSKADDYSNKKYIGSQFRKKRFQFFESKVEKLPKPISILDLGGTEAFWENENYHKNRMVDITILNLRMEGEGKHQNISFLQGDACDLSQFRDNEFDVVFSNSLIEHLFSWENQQKMASEVTRVGKYYFIQTPNRHFPVEPHFKFPFFQYLPDRMKIFLQTKTALINGVKYDNAYAEEVIREIRLLSKEEFQSLFPNSRLYVERFMGMEKSFIAHNFD